jgi:hypothetical protein
MTAVLAWLALAERYRARDGRFIPLIIGAAGGLVLSTRGIVLPVYAVAFAFWFRDDLWRGLWFALGCAAGFGITIIPFLVWDWQSFVSAGPFAVQTSYMPVRGALFAVAVGIAAGWTARSRRAAGFAAALILFAVVLVPFAASVIEYGWNGAVMGDRFDISYFCFALPFLIVLPEWRRDGG